MSEKMHGHPDILRSYDSLSNHQSTLMLNTEYLNTLNPNGFPPHTLRVKPNMPLMLLRNLNPREGLCNGTKLVFEKTLNNKVLICKVIGSDRTVLIPRIVFIPKAGEFPFHWSRKQFPVKTAFATTINKSQGQTLKFCGVWLRGQIFTHGQLYVACSRVGNPDKLKFAIMNNLV